MQGCSLDERLGIEGDAIAFVNLHSQFDGSNGCEACIAKDRRNAEVLVVHNAGDDVVQFLLKHIHRSIHFCYGFNLLLWLRQRTLVDLLVLVERYCIYLHGDCRNHVRRLLVEDEVVERFDIYLLIAYDVSSDELAATGAFDIECLHSSILDAWELTDDGLHFFEFDAEASDLHLPIATTYELNVSIRKEANYIASSIDTAVLLVRREGVADVSLRSLLGTIQVAAAHLRSCPPKFTCCSDGQAMALLVDDVEAHVVERLADGYLLKLLLDAVCGREDSALRRTIHIIELVTFWGNK